MSINRKKCLEILDLSEDATSRDIQDAYRTMVKVWHPDRFVNDQKMYHRAQEKLKLINLAHDWLEEHPVDAFPKDIKFAPRPSGSAYTNTTPPSTSAFSGSSTNASTYTGSKNKIKNKEMYIGGLWATGWGIFLAGGGGFRILKYIALGERKITPPLPLIVFFFFLGLVLLYMGRMQIDGSRK